MELRNSVKAKTFLKALRNFENGTSKLMNIFSACASSVIRVYFAIKLSQSDDFTYYVNIVGLWSYAEVASAILAMCLPVSPKFFHHFKEDSSRLWYGLGCSLVKEKFFFRPRTEPSSTRTPRGTDDMRCIDDENENENGTSKFSLPDNSKSKKKYNGLFDDNELLQITLQSDSDSERGINTPTRKSTADMESSASLDAVHIV